MSECCFSDARVVHCTSDQSEAGTVMLSVHMGHSDKKHSNKTTNNLTVTCTITTFKQKCSLTPSNIKIHFKTVTYFQKTKYMDILTMRNNLAYL